MKNEAHPFSRFDVRRDWRIASYVDKLPSWPNGATSLKENSPDTSLRGVRRSSKPGLDVANSGERCVVFATVEVNVHTSRLSDWTNKWIWAPISAIDILIIVLMFKSRLSDYQMFVGHYHIILVSQIGIKYKNLDTFILYFYIVLTSRICFYISNSALNVLKLIFKTKFLLRNINILYSYFYW